MSRSLTRTAVLFAGAALLGATALAAPAAAAPQPAAGSPDAIAAYKASHDTDPHLTATPAQLAAQAQEDRQANDYLTAKRLALAAGGANPDAAEKTLPGTQQAQQTGYWCGPAAVVEALAVRNVKISQSTAANLLGTTSNGTDWYGSDGNIPAAYKTSYPVPDVLSYELHGQGATYHPTALSYNPTAAEKSTFRSHLVATIDGGWDLVGNAYEVPGGPHLVGHPNATIYHYFTIRGYTSSGANTEYEDSVHGASTISWSGGVPAYSTLPSDTITTINGGRGYIW